MIPERPYDLVYKSTKLKPEWCQDLFCWIYPIPVNYVNADLHDAELVRFFEDQYLAQHGMPASLSFVPERDVKYTGNIGYICYLNDQSTSRCGTQ